MRKETVVTAKESGGRPLLFATANVYLAVPKNFCGIRLIIGKEPLAPNGSHYGVTPNACRTLRS